MKVGFTILMQEEEGGLERSRQSKIQGREGDLASNICLCTVTLLTVFGQVQYLE
jgi:hypothetical protein